MENSISGVILAGGDNKRFGGIIKSKIVIGGEPIILRIINAIKDLFGEIIIVTNAPEKYREYLQCKIVRDQFLKFGPLGGIHAAMQSSSNDAIFVIAGDMPFIDKRIILDQINAFDRTKHDILIPRVGHNIEPLHAIYSTSVLKELEIFLNQGRVRSVRDFLAEMKAEYFQIKESEESKKAFTNINSASDIAHIKQIYKN
jgi:molybdopterin-guanine dinucleotide biosynthesis protein A